MVGFGVWGSGFGGGKERVQVDGRQQTGGKRGRGRRGGGEGRGERNGGHHKDTKAEGDPGQARPAREAHATSRLGQEMAEVPAVLRAASLPRGHGQGLPKPAGGLPWPSATLTVPGTGRRAGGRREDMLAWWKASLAESLGRARRLRKRERCSRTPKARRARREKVRAIG